MLVGDVHPDVADVAGAITPVPGGVGPLTIAMLMSNTVRPRGCGAVPLATERSGRRLQCAADAARRTDRRDRFGKIDGGGHAARAWHVRCWMPTRWATNCSNQGRLPTTKWCASSARRCWPRRNNGSRKLGAIVFADAAKRARLNQILHPRILEVVQQMVRGAGPTGRSGFGFRGSGADLSRRR